jgi:hypothetical protein
MKGMVARLLGVSFVLAAFGVSLTAGPAAKPPAAGTPLITDWSGRHVVFSQPRTPEQAARLAKDIRYQQQQARQHTRPVVSNQVDQATLARFRRYGHHRRHRLHRDWSWDLGPGATVGADNAPAKYSFSSTVANCGLAANPDFVVYNTNLAGSATQGTIVALTNLYAGCSGPVPGSFWSYNTGGQVNTSPITSLDGSQVAFTQVSGGTASLVLLKWLKFDGQVNNPATDLTSVSASGYPTCTVPCMTSFSLGANDTNSSVYYDFGADTIYVGDDSGKLHQYTGVFLGTPAEVTTSPWPVPVSGAMLTSTVHDPATLNTFVGDKGGFLYRVDATGAVTKSAQLDFSSGGLTDPPMIDATIGSAYVFSSKDGAASTTAGVFQLSTTFVTGGTGPEATIGTASTGTTPVYDGAFDHNYISSANSTGNLYACGNPGGAPTLYQIPVNAGVLGTPLAGPIVSTTTTTPCSPATDVYNANVTGAGLPQEWVFLSVQAAGSPTACNSHSCAMSFKVTSWQPSFTYNIGQEVLDSNFNIEVAENSGFSSGLTAPSWGTAVYSQTNDNGVHWRNQGPVLSAPPNPLWAATTAYAGAAEIIDTNNNIEIAEPTGGTSGGTQPIWPLGEGVTTNDGTIVWYNLGANPVAGLQEPGGTSAIIIDNVSNLNGASQVYFTTLQNDGCFTSGGTGGCAVQASQQGLN